MAMPTRPATCWLPNIAPWLPVPMIRPPIQMPSLAEKFWSRIVMRKTTLSTSLSQKAEALWTARTGNLFRFAKSEEPFQNQMNSEGGPIRWRAAMTSAWLRCVKEAEAARGGLFTDRNQYSDFPDRSVGLKHIVRRIKRRWCVMATPVNEDNTAHRQWNFKKPFTAVELGLQLKKTPRPSTELWYTQKTEASRLANGPCRPHVPVTLTEAIGKMTFAEAGVQSGLK